MANDVNENTLRAAAAASFFRQVTPHLRATGLRTQELRYRSLEQGVDARVAEDFLVNSRLHRRNREIEQSIANYFTDPSTLTLSLAAQESEPAACAVALPEGPALTLELGEALSQRRSQRMYTGDPLDQATLATLLRSGSGITARLPIALREGGEVTYDLRTAPSGGGLYPIELHVAVLRVSGLERGLYRYSPSEDALFPTAGAQVVTDLLKSFPVPEELISLNRASAVILFVGQPWKSMRKYGARGMRFMFFEAGAIAQNIHLATAALGCGSVDCASYYDDEVHELLGIDGLHQAVLHSVVVGFPG
jgi:SagB-type dehydrogenase family enzyme